jgi:transposase
MLPCPLLSREDSQSWRHSLRELFSGVLYIGCTANQWRYMPNDLPPWPAVYEQMRRWMEAGVFEVLVADVLSLLREFGGRES